MSATRSTASQKAYRLSLRLTFACDFAAVREAVGSARAWLAEQGIGEADLSAWELALVEAWLKPQLEKAGVRMGRDRMFEELRKKHLLLEPEPAAYPHTTQSGSSGKCVPGLRDRI